MEQEGKKLSDLISQLNGVEVIREDGYGDDEPLIYSIVVETKYQGADITLRNLFLRLNREGISNALHYCYKDDYIINVFTFDFTPDMFNSVYDKMSIIIKEFVNARALYD